MTLAGHLFVADGELDEDSQGDETLEGAEEADGGLLVAVEDCRVGGLGHGCGGEGAGERGWRGHYR